MELGTILQALHDSEINAGVQSFFDRCWTVWIGDEMNGRKSEATVETAADAAEWLQDEADRLYPDSEFAKAA